MKILYSWLNDFISLKDSPEKIGEKLFVHSLNVEKINKDQKSGDAIFDIELTPDRGDCLSHLGIARELAAIYTKKLKKSIKPKFSQSASSQIKVDVQNKKLCPRYSTRVISGVKIKESPQWLKNRLSKLGVATINNVVDITNYIMLSYGQPMHAFDLEKISDRKIVVRNANKDEKMIDLDNKAQILQEADLVISDTKKPIAIAGIFGSLDSGITKNTKNIVLESAFFDAVSVRLTSERLNLATDASYRFERGTDIGATVCALDYATELILQDAGGNAQKKIDIYDKFSNRKIKIDYKKVNQLLGIKIGSSLIDRILLSLGFQIKNNFVIVPSFRTDINILEDIVEEVGRIYGYNKLPKTELKLKKFDNTNTSWFKKEKIKDKLTELGLTEVYNYSFVSELDLANFKIRKDPQSKLVNPLSPECAYMRPNMLIGLVKTIAKNPSFDPIEIFEIGEVFKGNAENTELAIALCGHKARKIDEVIFQLSKSLKIPTQFIKNNSVAVDIDLDILRKYKIRKSKIEILGIYIDDLLKTAKFSKKPIQLSIEKSSYKEISKFPSVQRDIAIVVDRKIKAEDIKKELLSCEMIKTVNLFDEYVSDKFGTDKKSLAFRINYASTKRTLNKNEVSLEQEKMLLNIKNKFGAKLRG